MGVKVTLTVHAGNGQLSYVDAETYEKVYAAAEDNIPPNSVAIAIRT